MSRTRNVHTNTKKNMISSAADTQGERRKFNLSVFTACISLFLSIVTLISVLLTYVGTNNTIVTQQDANEINSKQVMMNYEIDSNEILNSLDQNDREYKYQIACFVLENYDSIFGDDAIKRQNVIDVMTVSFSQKDCSELFEKLKNLSKTPEQENAWSNGLFICNKVNQYEIGKNVKLSVQYFDKNDLSIMKSLNNLLSAKGYNVAYPLEQIDDIYGSEVRYFYSEDQQDAEKVKEVVDEYFASVGISLDIGITYMPGFQKSTLQGKIEVWVSSLS